MFLYYVACTLAHNNILQILENCKVISAETDLTSLGYRFLAICFSVCSFNINSSRCQSCREEDKSSYKDRNGAAFAYKWASNAKNGDLRVLCMRLGCPNYKKSIADDPYVKISMQIQHVSGNSQSVVQFLKSV